MEWTANRLVPTLIGGGVVLGLLASTAVNTQPKGAPEPPWRTAVRDTAYQPSNLTYVDHGPIDLSPNLPWLGTGPDGGVAPMPEDFYRGRAIALNADQSVMRAVASRAADYPIPDEAVDERPLAVREAVDEPTTRRAVEEVVDEPRFKIDGPRVADESDNETTVPTSAADPRLQARPNSFARKP